jgi:hypothetical protein
MAQNVVRETDPTQVYIEAPLWMQTILNNGAAYADFILDLTKSMKRVDNMISDFVKTNELDKARIMVGKREMLTELRHIVEAYRKEGGNKNA